MLEFSGAGRVKGGRLPDALRVGLTRALRSAEGEQVEVILRPLKNTRSARANRYYWYCLGVIAEDTGHHKEELHEFFRQEFLEPRVLRLSDDEGAAIERKVRPSTTRLTTTEFTAYVARIKEFALHRLNIVLPEPEDVAA